MKRFVYRAHRGSSLVEILVAMVILLVGIYSLVRLFPSGFTTILYGRNVSTAQALARGMLEQARVQASTMPDGIIAMNPVTGTAYPMLPVADELLRFPLDRNVPPDPRFSDVNKVRRVLGETTKIPAPTTNSPYMPSDGSTGQQLPVSIYILNFAPIYSPQTLVVYAGSPLRRVVFNGPPSDDELDRLDEYSYGIDYGNATLYFKPVTYDRRFKIESSFTIGAADGFVREHMQPGNGVFIPKGTESFDLRQPHPNQPADLQFRPLPAGARLQEDEEFLYRAFDPLGAEPFSNSDPYQYRVLNPVLGVIGFNPLAAMIRTQGGGSRGVIAKIDYDVDDWHILRDDRVVPFAPPYTVKLTVNGIQPIGDVDEYQETYTGLMRDYPDRGMNIGSLVNVDVLVMDLETGRVLDSRTLQNEDRQDVLAASATFNDLNGTINYTDGSIRFRDFVQWLRADSGAPDNPEPIAGRRIRVFYRTQQNWGVQLTKAFPSYSRELVLNNLGYREFMLGSEGYLYFPVQDHDHAVLVDYTWRHLVDGEEILRTETGEYQQISSPDEPLSPQNRAGSGAAPDLWWIQLDAAKRRDAVPNSIHVLRVRGVTVRARAIWREGERWRKLDLDSFIGRERGT
jgi:hypothetical protein